MTVPYFKQEKSTTCGPACVRMVLAYKGVEVTESALEEVCKTSWLGNTCEELATGSQEIGFQASYREFNIRKLERFIGTRNANYCHYRSGSHL
ncbi:MAG: cysteine peptidase family C39 domain-containing protein [Candidatus Anammoxibacter sp.]